MHKFISLFALATLAFFADSCTKEGLGGEAVLVVKLKHHGVVINNTATYRDTVFVKFNTKDAPANPTTDYDAMIVGEVGEDHVHVEGLKHGDYYLYGAGFDPAVNERVTGGLPVEIKRKDRKAEQLIDLSVVE
jgi:hypothetical protein